MMNSAKKVDVEKTAIRISVPKEGGEGRLKIGETTLIVRSSENGDSIIIKPLQVSDMKRERALPID